MSTNPRMWSVQCIIDWLSVCEREGHGFPSSVQELTEQMDHSALLRRLLEGKEALPEPPPLSFANPWYELVEKGVASPQEVWMQDFADGSIGGGGDSIIVNQHPWRIVRGNYSAESYVVRSGNSSVLYKLWMTGIGADELGVSRKLWRIERLVTT